MIRHVCLFKQNKKHCVITSDVSKLCVTLFICEGREGEKTFYLSLFSWITGMKTKMFLIIFLGIIATLTSVSDGCDIGTSEVDNFNWTAVSASILRGFLKQRALKLLLGFIYHLWFHSLSLNRAYRIAYSGVIELFMDKYLLMVRKYSLFSI
jgi:hypothetical protein